MANVKIGDVEVYIDYSDGNGEQFLGQTKGGVEFSFEREFEDLTVDKFGTAPIDMVLTGNNLTIKAYLAEPTVENIGHTIREGLFAESGNDSKLGLGTQAGLLMSTKQGALRLHPRKNAPANRSEDIFIFKAVSMESVELAYKVDEQRILEVTWRALVDETQPDGQHLGRIGDEAIS